MDAAKYLEEKTRMIKGDINGNCKILCNDCPLSYENNGLGIGCAGLEQYYPEKTVAIVEKWSEEHQLKTCAQVFFERFPDARREEDGSPRVCAKTIGLTDSCPEYSCYNCWNQPAPDKYQD